MMDNGTPVAVFCSFQPLSWAVSKKHQGVVKLLVERGADTQKLHCDGQTALDIAIAMDLQPVSSWLPAQEMKYMYMY